VTAQTDELLRQVADATSDNAAADAVILKLAVEDFVTVAKQLLAARERISALEAENESLRLERQELGQALDQVLDDQTRAEP
jgi:regulator of replication initiation timing